MVLLWAKLNVLFFRLFWDFEEGSFRGSVKSELFYTVIGFASLINSSFTQLPGTPTASHCLP